MTNREQLSMAAQNAAPSGIRRMFELARQYDDSINLTLGEPGFDTPDDITKALHRLLSAFCEKGV